MLEEGLISSQHFDSGFDQFAKPRFSQFETKQTQD
jgi:hypothetical protein